MISSTADCTFCLIAEEAHIHYFFTFGTWKRRVINARQGPPYPQGKNHVSHSTGSVIGSRTGVDAVAKRKSWSRHEWELDSLIALYQPSYPAHICRLFTGSSVSQLYQPKLSRAACGHQFNFNTLSSKRENRVSYIQESFPWASGGQPFVTARTLRHEWFGKYHTGLVKYILNI